MADKSKIAQRLMEEFTLMQGHKDNYLLGIFLAGSQNYKLDYENSDIDSKAIFIPSFKNFCLEENILSTTYKFDNGEQIDLKDIRNMFRCFLKQNINFLEILFTDYKVIDEVYWSTFNKLYSYREDIAHYDMNRAIKAMYGDMVGKFSRLDKIRPASEESIKKYGYDFKEFHHIMRLKEFVARYVDGEQYASCLVSKNPDFLIGIKRDPGQYSSNWKELGEKALNDTKDLVDKNFGTFGVKEEVKDYVNNVLVNIFKIAYQQELKENNYA